MSKFPHAGLIMDSDPIIQLISFQLFTFKEMGVNFGSFSARDLMMHPDGPAGFSPPQGLPHGPAVAQREEVL